MKQFSSVKEALKCTFTGRRQSSGSIVPVEHDRSQSTKDMMTLSIPTFSGRAETEEVDISQYTQDDLERLRLEDPFLYYSIPGMKQQLYGYGSDSSLKNSTSRSNVASRSSRRSSCPTILLTNSSQGSDGNQQQQRRGSVTRARRLSVEPHPSVVMKSIMNEMNIDYDSSEDSDIDEEDEEFIQALANGTFDEQ